MAQLKVLYLAAEVVPYVKTGGLADVAGALPKAVRALGHDIRVMLPRYGRVEPSKFGLKRLVERLDVRMDERVEPAAILAGSVGVGPSETPVYFVDNARLFDRQGLYMYPDDAERFIFFSRAALETCRALEWQPDVIHCNEWHTALVPNWLRTIYADDPFFSHTATVYTVHNLEYQGIFGYRVLEIAGLADLGFIVRPDVAPDRHYVVDLVARGLMFSDMINTVSETHAVEILTPEYGQGLDPILRERRDRLFGILNGIDTEVFNPATDPQIASPFSLSNPEKRVENKAALQAEVGLQTRPDAPLLGVVSRLTDQKGFDLIGEVADTVVHQLGCQLVIMGTGELKYHEMLSSLVSRHPGQVSALLTFGRPQEQRIYAGCDIFLMPSRFEPCGLNQMMAMRYGCVPVVHRVGGLADSVTDYSPETGLGNGFSFVEYEPMALYTSLVRAVEAYRHRDIWNQLVRRCLAADFSWNRSAARYVDLYYRALAARRRPS
jgi:starch synthase